MKKLTEWLFLTFTWMLIGYGAGAFPVHSSPSSLTGPDGDLADEILMMASGLKLGADHGEVSAVFPLTPNQELIFGGAYATGGNKGLVYPSSPKGRFVDLNEFNTPSDGIIGAAIPEPVTMLLVGFSLIGLAGIGRRLRR